MTTVVKKKKSRLRPKRGLGAQYTRARKTAADNARQKAEERKKQQRDAARRDLARRAERQAQAEKETDDKFRMSLLRQVQATQQAVLHAWGYSTPMQCSLSERMGVEAWTDFIRIVVNWPKHSMPGMTSRKREVTRCLVSMRGVFQHEAGHVRFTTPWHFIRDATPWKHYSPKGSDRYSENHDDQRLAKVNNVLEDQRMENLVVEVVPKIADYFKVMILDIIVDGAGKGGKDQMDSIDLSWLLLAGRRYLDNDVRVQSYSQFEQAMQGLGFPQGTAQHWADIVDEYIAAQTKAQLGKATEKAAKFLEEIGQEIPSSVDDHSRGMDEAGQGGGGLFDKEGNPEDGDDRANGGSRGGKATDGMNEDDLKKAKEGKLDGKSLEDAAKEAGQNAGIGDGGFTFAEQLRRARDGALQKVEDSKELKHVHGSAMDGAKYEGLPEYHGPTRDLDGESIVRAETIAQGMVQMLQSFVTANDPTWQFRVEDGYIDPLAYRTKEPGERTFRRYMEDQGKQVLDVHLSVLADCSGSMGHNMQALSEVLYGCALATEQVDIGSTYVLWSSGDQHFRVWETKEPQPDLFPSMGGTTPEPALDDIVNHNQEGAAHHLVVIFTDGQWYGDYNLQQWADPNKTLLFVRYGRYDGIVQNDMGADEHVQIDDVIELAEHIEYALSDVLSSLGGGDGGW